MIRKIKGLAHKYLTNPSVEFSKKSYSQCGEDLIVKFIFDTIGIPKPSFLDIGAHHPYHLSNTALLYENGSTGINIEPDPTLFQEFLRKREKDVNLNIGIAQEDGEQDFYIINAPTLNTFSKIEAEGYASEGNYFIKDIKKIRVLRVSSILTKYSSDRFPQFLSLDAEGVDETVLRSIDYSTYFPIVICVETIGFSTKGMGVKNVKIIDFLLSRGYLLYADTYINSIFIRKEYWAKN